MWHHKRHHLTNIKHIGRTARYIFKSEIFIPLYQRTKTKGILENAQTSVPQVRGCLDLVAEGLTFHFC